MGGRVGRVVRKDKVEENGAAREEMAPEALVVEPEEPAGHQISRGALVEKMIRKMESTLDQNKDIKTTLGDFIRLLQLQKELDDERPKEIKVTWVEPQEKESVPET